MRYIRVIKASVYVCVCVCVCVFKTEDAICFYKAFMKAISLMQLN